MEIEVLGCSGGQAPGSRTTSLLINGRVALDAGCLSQTLSTRRLLDLEAVLLTHSHIDHTGSLPFLVETRFGRDQSPLDVYAHPATIEAIRRHLFNDATWPDFTSFPEGSDLPPVRFHPLEAETPVDLGGVTWLPVLVSHQVPTFGFLLSEEGHTVLWSSDTGPTERLWEVAAGRQDLAAVCLEVSFDNSLQEVADKSLHLTPAGFARELEKLDRRVPVYAHHLKPFCQRAIEGELATLRRSGLELLRQGRVYRFPASDPAPA